VVYQHAGTVPLLGNFVLPDTVVLIKDLIGINSATLGTTAGANVVEIQDTQAPMPVGFALTSDGLAIDFTENAFASTSVALSMLKNGVTPMTITNVTGTTSLDFHTNQSLAATDWVLVDYTGTNITNGIRDASNNVMTEEDPTYGGSADGRDGDNTINLNGIAIAGMNYDIYGNGGNDTLIGSGGEEWIKGGTGADTMTGSGGMDSFNFEQGDSPAVTARNLGGDSVLNSGDTFSFASGVDRITDFSSDDDGIELSQPMRDILGSSGSPTYMGGAPVDGLATDQGYFAVQGNFSGSTFTVNTASGADTLIVWDGDSSAAVTQTGIVLSGVTLAQLNLQTGSNWISHV
jgi:serralysin